MQIKQVLVGLMILCVLHAQAQSLAIGDTLVFTNIKSDETMPLVVDSTYLKNVKIHGGLAIVTTGGVFEPVDTILLEKAEYQVNDLFKFTVQSAQKTKFMLDGGCEGAQLTYMLFMVSGKTDTVVYENTQVQMDCGMPTTEPTYTFSSHLKEGITQPGNYFMRITAGDRVFQSATFTVAPLKPHKYYGLAELREPSINFPNEMHYTQTMVYFELKANGKYEYNYGNLVSGKGTYTVNKKTITFTQTEGGEGVKNKGLLLSGEYSFYFIDGHLTLHKYIANNSYYIYRFN